MASGSGPARGAHRHRRTSPLEALTDAHFLQKFRLSKAAVVILQNYLHNSVLSTSDIPLQLQLLTALRFFATGKVARAAGVARLPTTRTRTVVGHVSSTLVNELKDHFLDFPDTQQQETFKADFQEIGQLVNVIGCINSIPIPLAGFLGMELGVGNQQYGQRLLKLLVVCGPQGQITSLMVQPYAEGDWQTFRDSCLLDALQNDEYDGYVLANLNFPPRRYFLIPIANPANWMDELFNFAHFTTLQVSNHALNLLTARFPCLVAAMDGIYPSNLNVVAACAILHNLCLKLSVPAPPGNPNAHPINLPFQNRAQPPRSHCREE